MGVGRHWFEGYRVKHVAPTLEAPFAMHRYIASMCSWLLINVT